MSFFLLCSIFFVTNSLNTGVRILVLSDSCHSGTVIDTTGSGSTKVKASVILISGCADSQFSRDGTKNGVFTENLLKVWNSGKFKGNYTQFHSQIISKMKKDQQPVLSFIGKRNAIFENQIPFTV